MQECGTPRSGVVLIEINGLDIDLLYDDEFAYHLSQATPATISITGQSLNPVYASGL